MLDSHRRSDGRCRGRLSLGEGRFSLSRPKSRTEVRICPRAEGWTAAERGLGRNEEEGQLCLRHRPGPGGGGRSLRGRALAQRQGQGRERGRGRGCCVVQDLKPAGELVPGRNRHRGKGRGAAAAGVETVAGARAGAGEGGGAAEGAGAAAGAGARGQE